MIRRKIWATATFCLAVAGAARAQTPTTVTVAPISQGSGMMMQGAQPAPGTPRYIPRNYAAPSAISYGSTPAMPAAQAMPAMSVQAVSPMNHGPVPLGAVAAPVEGFAVDTETQAVGPTPGPMGVAPGSPMPGATLVPMPMTAPAPVPVIDATVQMPGMIPPGGVYGGPTMGGQMMPGPALNGGPIVDAPYLSGMGSYGEGAQPCVWVTGEYLNWRLKSVNLPPIVTTSPAGSTGTIFDGNATVVYGDSHILENWQSGYRLRGGMWFPDGVSGLDIAFFSIDVSTDRNTFASDGGQGIFKPFFNTALRAEDAQLIAFSPVLSGTVTSVSQAMLWGGEANYRTGWGMGLGGKLDALIGYRYLNFHDRLTIDSRSLTLAPVGGASVGTQIATTDRFDAQNQFHGAQVGFVGEWQIGMMSFGLRGTVAGGWTTQTVDISGTTSSLVPGGSTFITPGALFAQSTNIGNHSQSRFSVVPEAGVTLGYQCTNNIRIFGGYNVLCWTNTVRAGEQINRAVNSTYIPDPITGAQAKIGAPAPLFQFRDDNFWVHGYSVGVEFRW